MKNLKNLSREQLKDINGSGDQWPYEGAPCYCNGVFKGYPSTPQGCVYLCDPQHPNLPGLPAQQGLEDSTE